MIFSHGVGLVFVGIVFVDHIFVGNIDGESISFFFFSLVEFLVFNFEAFEVSGDGGEFLWVESQVSSGGGKH